MKPLTHCPYCQALLEKNSIPEHLNNMKYEICSQRCTVDYQQYYKKSYEETELSYISYNTPNKKFYLYTYFNHWMYQFASLVYSRDTLNKNGLAMPILTLPLDKYPFDLSDLEKIQEKISTLSLFV